MRNRLRSNHVYALKSLETLGGGQVAIGGVVVYIYNLKYFAAILGCPLKTR